MYLRVRDTDEYGLFYNLLPNKTLFPRKENGMEENQRTG
jgi:hypothetical protein